VHATVIRAPSARRGVCQHVPRVPGPDPCISTQRYLGGSEHRIRANAGQTIRSGLDDATAGYYDELVVVGGLPTGPHNANQSG